MSPAVVSILGRQKNAHFYYNLTQVTVKAKIDGSPNTIFNFQCPGNSSHSHTLLLYKDGHVNREISEVCKDRYVRVAFNQYPGFIEINNETNTMVEYPVWHDYPASSWRWEVLSSFFTNNRLIPIFIETNAFGILDKDTGLWSGAVAMVNSLVFFRWQSHLHKKRCPTGRLVRLDMLSNPTGLFVPTICKGKGKTKMTYETYGRTF